MQYSLILHSTDHPKHPWSLHRSYGSLPDGKRKLNPRPTYGSQHRKAPSNPHYRSLSGGLSLDCPHNHGIPFIEPCPYGCLQLENQLIKRLLSPVNRFKAPTMRSPTKPKSLLRITTQYLRADPQTSPFNHQKKQSSIYRCGHFQKALK